MDFSNALSGIRDKLSGDEGAARLYGAGLVLSQLGSGQAPNAGPALQLLQERKSANALKAQMAGGAHMNRFTPEEQAFLSTLPPAAAQQLIAQRLFAAPAAPVQGTEINGQLVNPITGELMGDFRDDETAQVETVVIDGKLVNKATGELIADHGDSNVGYIADAEASAALGLDPVAHNISVIDGVQSASPVGGGPQTVIHNGGVDESAFSVATGKLLAQEASDIAVAGAAAQSALGSIDTLAGALSSGPTGFAASLTNAAGNLGIKLDGLDNVQLANAIISKLVPQQRPPGTGPMSDADLELFKNSLPRLINTPEGNAKIIDTMRAIALYDVERGKIARAHQLGEISARDAFSQYAALGNPMAGFAVPNSDASANQPVELNGFTIREIN